MAEAALALAIALPLLASVLSLPLGRRAPHLLWLVIPGALAIAAVIAERVRNDGEVLHLLGGWPAPLGIVLRADGLAAAFLGLGAVVASGTGLFAVRYFAADEGTRRSFSFWPLFFALWAAANATFLGRDTFNLYVALELLTICAVAMVALEGRTANVAAGMRYMLYALLGSLSFLIGVALLYGAYGTLDMAQLAARVRPAPASHAAAAMMSVGLFAKTALFPFHAWLPPAHGGAPAPASALLSAIVVKASFYVLLRLWFDVLPPLATPEVTMLFGALGTMAVLAGSLLALRQEELKQVVAYSTVAQTGYLFLVFPLAGAATEVQPWAASAWTGGVFQGLSHGLAKAAMFLATGALILSAGSGRIDALAGLGRAAPVASFAFGLSALSLMGLPPSGGFLAKYLMLTASLAGGRWWWGLVLMAGGLLTAAYFFRPLSRLMMERDEAAPAARRVHWSLEWIPLVLALCAVGLGLASSEPFRLAQVGSPVAAETGLQ